MSTRLTSERGESKIRKFLNRIDVNNMTPIEALQTLNALKNDIDISCFMILSTGGFCEKNWVNYGWNFLIMLMMQSASLGTANSAYNVSTPHASIINPSHLIKIQNNVSLTHQSRFANMVNSELIGFQLGDKSEIININIIYQGISKIPDTRTSLIGAKMANLVQTIVVRAMVSLIPERAR